jgi:uncharacterized membrane protein YtjA (UPF0391 family)
MLRLALVFLLIALLAALFGFTSIAWISSEAAQILFFVFLVLFILALIGNVARRKPTDLV